MPRTVPTTKNFPAPMSRVLRLRNVLWSNEENKFLLHATRMTVTNKTLSKEVSQKRVHEVVFYELQKQTKLCLVREIRVVVNLG